MIQRVRFFAEDELVALPGVASTGVISIVDPPHLSDPEFGHRFAELQEGWYSILRLWFHDISKPWQNYILFDDELADIVIDWLLLHERKLSCVYVHCAAGESRSAGVARFLCKVYGVPFDSEAGKGFNPRVYRVLVNRWHKRKLRRSG